MCRRKKGKQAGFQHIGPSKKQPDWTLYRAEADSRLRPRTTERPESERGRGGEEEVEENPAEQRWHWFAVKHKTGLTAEKRQELSALLGLPLYSLDCFPLLGWRRDYRDGNHYLFPMHNAQGDCMGIMRRWHDKPKKIILGGQQGLFIPHCPADRDRPVYLVEGPTDTMACYAMGLQVIGRPGNRHGVEHLADLLSDWPAGTPIVVMGENDANEEGKWPGKDGAVETATKLAGVLHRQVFWCLPPAGSKDVRAWCQDKEAPGGSIDDWHKLGSWLESKITLNAVGGAEKLDDGGLILTSMDTVKEELVEWLVEPYFPLGELHILGADTTMGKSMVCMHVAAQLSLGEPCFGLSYPRHEPVHSLFASREDSKRKTVLPRLQALGADLKRVKLIDGLPGQKGKIEPFSLAELDRLKKELDKDPKIKYIVIDPVDSYISGTGVDDFRAASLRDKIIDPMQELCIERQLVIMMILHLNKGDSKKASHRLANSSAYSTGSRVGYMAFAEPGSETNRVFGCTKINCGQKPASLLYRICLCGPSRTSHVLANTKVKMTTQEQERYAKQLVVAEFIGFTDLSPDDCCAAEQEEEQENQFDTDKAAKWLRTYLQHGPKPALDCLQDGNKYLCENFSDKWWRGKILTKKCGGKSKRDGANACWVWCLENQTPGEQKTPFDGQ
jgi:hypothetical protein